ncbi:type III pantothenate kinase [Bizionia sediminis]|uniref:Type III pantothenate kinase n=1 Tax=Bizionia sediminis TaxID=1737064 RepID=A0ABW5KVP9_9FLAO
MNLIIDIGNTRVKTAVFQGYELLVKENDVLNNLENKIQLLMARFPEIKNCILSSVGLQTQIPAQLLPKHLHTLILNPKTPLPIINGYETPKTLGMDRLALACAAANKYPNNDCLIIDVGTCITYDFISKNNRYLGGAISPGLQLRYTALNSLTANLPLLKPETPKALIGTTTNGAIHAGVVYGILSEIDGVIARYQEKYSDLTVILTGGDTNFLSKQLKSSIFAHSNFLLEGLNHILHYNTNE